MPVPPVRAEALPTTGVGVFWMLIVVLLPAHPSDARAPARPAPRVAQIAVLAPRDGALAASDESLARSGEGWPLLPGVAGGVAGLPDVHCAVTRLSPADSTFRPRRELCHSRAFLRAIRRIATSCYLGVGGTTTDGRATAGVARPSGRVRRGRAATARAGPSEGISRG